MPIEKGTALGTDIEMRTISAGAGQEITGVVAHGEHLSFQMRETREAGRFRKTFAGDKGMLESMPGDTMRQKQTDIGVQRFIRDSSKATTVMNWKKNRYLHNVQMFTALQETVDDMRAKNQLKHRSSAAQEIADRLLNRPVDTIRGLGERVAAAPDMGGNDLAVREMWEAARTLRVSSKSAGLIFGGLTEIAGKEGVESYLSGIGVDTKGVSTAWFDRIKEGVAGGTALLTHGESLAGRTGISGVN